MVGVPGFVMAHYRVQDGEQLMHTGDDALFWACSGQQALVEVAQVRVEAHGRSGSPCRGRNAPLRVRPAPRGPRARRRCRG